PNVHICSVCLHLGSSSAVLRHCGFASTDRSPTAIMVGPVYKHHHSRQSDIVEYPAIQTLNPLPCGSFGGGSTRAKVCGHPSQAFSGGPHGNIFSACPGQTGRSLGRRGTGGWENETEGR